MAQGPNTDDTEHRNRIGLVTGSAHGIGKGIADLLLRDGWTVFGCDSSVQEERERFHPLQTDIADPAAIDQALEQVRTKTDRLDGLVSNAGIMIRKPLSDLSFDEWSRVIATNLSALFLIAKGTRTLLQESDQAAIVAIASTRAHMSEPDTESYAASKGGLVALTHALSISLGPAIRVNCISPGWIDVSGEALTREDHAQHPVGRVGRVEDVASMAAWLLGRDSGFVTGAEFVVDGGMTRKMIYR